MTPFPLLALLLFAGAAFASPDFLLGTWKNELGSVMTIEVTTDSGFSGLYRTAVSGNGSVLEAPLAGTFNAAEAKAGTIAFVVDWQYLDGAGKEVFSTTTWCGIVRGAAMRTTWLLTRYGESDWENTNVGSDDFYKL